MKVRLLPILLVLSSSLVACSDNVKSKLAIVPMTNIDPVVDGERIVPITSTEFFSFVEGHATFPILFKLDGCSSCQTANKVINNYLSKNNFCIRSLTVNPKTFKELENKFPNQFNDEITFPNLFVYDKGKLTYKFTQSNLIRENSFKAEANKMFISSKLNVCSDEEVLKQHISNSENSLMISYQRTSFQDLFTTYSEFYEKLKSSNKTAIFFENLFESNGPSVYLIQNGKIKTSINYLEDASSAIELVNSYLL